MNNICIDNFIVTFFSGKKEYRSLSNFWENDIIVENEDKNRIYESGEHCFHGEKYIRLSELSNDENRKNILFNYGKTFIKPSQYKTSIMAKKMGGKKGLILNSYELEKWTLISIDIQKNICKWKITNYEEVRNDLQKSKDKILVHPAMRCSLEKIENRIWEGRAKIIDNKIIIYGKNLLGNIWMEYRDRDNY
jgi:predicted NAD-dependent protein-ADP-ribosyltransferase YbiA (DUF1768 family)